MMLFLAVRLAACTSRVGLLDSLLVHLLVFHIEVLHVDETLILILRALDNLELVGLGKHTLVVSAGLRLVHDVHSMFASINQHLSNMRILIKPSGKLT